MQHLYVSYNSELNLRNKHTTKCVGLECLTKKLRADYPPSYVELKDNSNNQKSQYTVKIKIINRDQRQLKSQFILEGTRIHLVNTVNDEYATCFSNGQISFEKKTSLHQENNKQLYKASTWTVQFLKNQSKTVIHDKQFITIYDEICFKSVHATYISLKPGSFQLCASTDMDPSKSVWNLTKANVPFVPEWAFKRKPFSNLSKLYPNLQTPVQQVRQKRLLKSYPPEVQEQLLIQDLMDNMLGDDGVFIKRNKKFIYQFNIQPHLQNPTCSIALRQLVEKILVLPSHYIKIESYIQTYGIQQGILCQALCGGLRKLIKQYKVMVSVIDQKSNKEKVTLQKLWFNLQPKIKSLQALSNLVIQAQKVKGGQLLTLLSKLLNQNTDQQTINFYTYLFSTILEVYVQMLSKWLYEGIIDDRYGQFMIKTEQRSHNKQWTYWDQKFFIREDMVPSIFSKQANQILVTGKYLNVLKTCNKLADHPYRKQIFQKFQHFVSIQNFSEPIFKAYEWANSQMLQLVFTQCKFNQVLKSIKGYFFLQYGDLFVHFMDAAQQDLSILKKKNQNQEFRVGGKSKSKQFSQQKIQNLFQLLIRTSSANSDPFKDDITCRAEALTIYDQVKNIKNKQPQMFPSQPGEKSFVKRDSKYADFLTIEYKCQFPLTLIFNKSSMEKYQVLFRFIFWCKFIQRQLNNVWLSLQSTKQIPLPLYNPAYMLNQRMINFIKNLIYYLCYQVIEQNWLIFTQNLKKVKTFEDIIQCHTNFLNKCIKESLLSQSRLLTIITSDMGKSCQGFTLIRNFLNSLLDQFNFQSIPTNPKTGSIISQRKIYLEQLRQHIKQALQEKQFRNIVQSCGTSFDDAMRTLLRQINSLIGKQQNHLLNLINRLDEEKFYNKRLFGGNSSMKQI